MKRKILSLALALVTVIGLLPIVPAPQAVAETDGYSHDFSAFSAAGAPEFEVVKLAGTYPDEDSIVLTLMGDGYTADGQNDFLDIAAFVSGYILDFYPFSLFKDKMNIYAVKVISGAGEKYFNSTNSAGEVRGLTSNSNARHLGRDTALAHVPRTDVTAIIANSPLFGGIAVRGLTVVGSGSGLNKALTSQVMVHELGHALGDLEDEYWIGSTNFLGATAVNVSRSGELRRVPWRHWVGHDGIGIFPFGGTPPPLFRPSQTCIMSAISSGFCSVCSSHLTGTLAGIVGEPFYGIRRVVDRERVIDKVALPNGTERVLNYAFNGCGNLMAVSIPDTVTSIGRYAFLACSGLRIVVNRAVTPQTVDDTVFAGVTRSNVTLYVPEGTRAAYEAAGWSGFKEIRGLDELDACLFGCTGDCIDYTDADVTVPGSEPGFEINLTKETVAIPAGFSVTQFSTDGGAKWRAVKADTFSAARFPRLLNKDLTLHITNGTDTVTFPKINKRAAAPKLRVNYAVYADEYGATPGKWALAARGGTAAVKNGIQVGAADAAQKSRVVDGNGFGRFSERGGICVKPLTGARPQRTAYFIRTAPTSTTAASRARRVRAAGQNKPTSFSVRERAAAAVIRVRANTYIQLPDGEIKYYRDKGEENVADVHGTVQLWTGATARRAASAKQTIRR